MRLGFDLDGTLADMQTALLREARLLFPGVDLASIPTSAAGVSAQSEPEDVDRKADQNLFSTSSLTVRQQRELWKVVRSRHNFWETLDELEPGMLARLYRLSIERKWQVIFLTSRPESAGDPAQLQTHRWLSAHGFETPSIFVVHGSRGRIAAALALDVFVDDRPENCLDIAIDSPARPILVWRGEEDKVPVSARQLGIGSVTSVARCLDILQESDEATTDTGGLVNRLKQIFGLSSRTDRRPKRSPDQGSALTRA